MRRLGLTGSIGSGKSTVAKILRELGLPVLDADVYAHEGALVLQKEICVAFPEACLEGKLDRQALGRWVFNDDEARKVLESILHPYVRQRFAEELEKLRVQNQAVVVLEIPLLFEGGWEERLNGILVVATPDDLRIKRVMQRSGLSEREVRERDAAQMPQAEKVRRATWLIWNDSNLDELREKVQHWYKKELK